MHTILLMQQRVIKPELSWLLFTVDEFIHINWTFSITT